MLGMLGGRQRSLPEWRRLLEDGGLTLRRVTTGSGQYAALEATIG
jgi:hypothetical protein